ncbi:MAG: TrkH family potassium uptake protein [Alphaproteobacteria bacterium]|nr:MAG: TrkH family potassium uptake protein [Alphaproteobacteria bacterium]
MWQSRLFYLIGCWILILAALQVPALLVAIGLGEQAAADALIASCLLAALIGGSLFFGFRSTEPVRVRRLTVLLPILGGMSLALMAGLPFFFLIPEQGIMPAFYDGMSLVTTTGTSAYEGAMEKFRSLHLWRALASWFGGFMAIAVTLSLLTALNSGGLQVRRSALPYGDSEVGYPRLKSVAQTIYPIYVTMTVVCCALLMLSDMPLLDAAVLSMATISTSGIGVGTDAVVAGFWPQLVTALFMVLAICNWDMLFMRTRRLRLDAGRDPEQQTILFIILAGAALLVLFGGLGGRAHVWDSLFGAISALSGTGLLPADFQRGQDNLLPVGIIMLILAGIGGGVAGTGGGLKTMRIMLIYALGKSEVERLAHPHGVRSIKYGRDPVAAGDIEAVWLLLGAFVLVLVFGAVAFAVLGVHFQTALSMSYTALTLSGPLIGLADPHFTGFSGLRDVDYALLSALMLVGRVEASVVIALFARSFWRG